MWREAAGTEHVVATVTHTFAPGSGVMFDADLAGAAAPAQAGDQLIYRFTNVSTAAGATYTPNGDGALVGARIPSLMLPE